MGVTFGSLVFAVCLLVGAAVNLLVVGAAVKAWQERRAVRKARRELDRMLMRWQYERAHMSSAAPASLLVPMDTVIASLTRVRMGVAEGRVRDLDLEIAAVRAAAEQMRVKGDRHDSDA